MEELRVFKVSMEAKMKDLKGRVEILTEEVDQAEVSTRTFTLEQVFWESLTPELAKKELDATVTL